MFEDGSSLSYTSLVIATGGRYVENNILQIFEPDI
jgi:hypothetical protein